MCLPGCTDLPPEGQVFGKVTYKGAPVTEGTVSFHNATAGLGGDAAIGADGSYRFATGVGVGDYQVSIYPPVVIDSSDPRTPPVSVYKKVENIPTKYHHPETSTLTATVKEGDNPLDFELQ
jgi:hypothetical protein